MNMLSKITKISSYSDNQMRIGPEGENLVFLISQPRSGSTLLQMILAGNPEIATTSEPWIALHPISAFHDDAIDPQYGANQAKQALFEFLKGSGVSIAFYKKQVSTFLRSLYSQAITHQDKKYFLDKTPRYYYIIDDLYYLFPKAKFIILFRNPLAILNSVLKTWVKDDYSLLVNNFDDLMIAPQKLVHFCREMPQSCFSVHYEKLVSDPEMVTGNLCDFLGIRYTQEMIDYGKRDDPEWKYGDQIGIKKSSRPFGKSADKWKNGFEDSRDKMLAFSYLDALGKPLIGDMGYAYDEIISSIGVRPSDSKLETISWSAVSDVINCISSIKDVRRVVFRALLNEGYFNNNFDANEVNWSEYQKKAVDALIRLRENKLVNEVHDLRKSNNELSSQTIKLKNDIESMQRTLSWRLTSPLRNSKLLRAIAKKTHFK